MEGCKVMTREFDIAIRDTDDEPNRDAHPVDPWFDVFA